MVPMQTFVYIYVSGSSKIQMLMIFIEPHASYGGCG